MNCRCIKKCFYLLHDGQLVMTHYKPIYFVCMGIWKELLYSFWIELKVFNLNNRHFLLSFNILNICHWKELLYLSLHTNLTHYDLYVAKVYQHSSTSSFHFWSVCVCLLLSAHIYIQYKLWHIKKLWFLALSKGRFENICLPSNKDCSVKV